MSSAQPSTGRFRNFRYDHMSCRSSNIYENGDDRRVKCNLTHSNKQDNIVDVDVDVDEIVSLPKLVRICEGCR